MQVSETMVQVINTIHAAILGNTKLIGRAMRIATGNELRVNTLCDANLIDKVESLTKEVESLKAENAKVKESKAEWVALFNDAISQAISDLDLAVLAREDYMKDDIIFNAGRVETLSQEVRELGGQLDELSHCLERTDSVIAGHRADYKQWVKELHQRADCNHNIGEEVRYSVNQLAKRVDVIEGDATEAITDAKFAKDSGFNLRADLSKLEDKVNTLTGNVDGSLDALDFSVDLLKMEVRSLVNREADKADRVSEILAQLDEEG